MTLEPHTCVGKSANLGNDPRTNATRFWFSIARRSCLGFLFGMASTNLATAQDADPFLVQPDVRDECLVFVSHGDIWATSKNENWVARNLTASPEAESNPKLSPDGQSVAFNHPSDGVFVIPFQGGIAKQLTFKGNPGPVLCWTQDGRIAYAGHESAPFPDSIGLSFVHPRGGQPQHTGVAEIGYAWFDPFSDVMLYSKSNVSTGTNAKFHGGKANQILQLDLKTGKFEHLFPSKYSRHATVMLDGDIFFVGTESDSTLNLWQIHEGQFSRRTDFKHDGIRNLSSDGKRLIVEQAGRLYWFDRQRRMLDRIPINLADPRNPPQKITTEVQASPTEIEPTSDGTAVAVVSRGEVFVSENGTFQNISQHSGANDSDIHWSIDGQNLAFVSDRTRENAIYLWHRSTNQLRLLAPGTRQPVWLAWSPKGDGLYYLLDRQALHWVDFATGRDQAIAPIDRWVTSHSVSSDGRYLALTTALENQRTSLLLLDRTSQQCIPVTDPRYIDTSCIFDPQKPILYFLSRRNGRPNLTGELPDLNLAGGMSLAQIDLEHLSVSPPCDFRSRTHWIDLQGKDVETLSFHPQGIVVSGNEGSSLFNTKTKVLRSLDSDGERQYSWGPSGNSRAWVEKDHLHVETWAENWKSTSDLSLAVPFEVDLPSEWESMFWAVHRFQRDQFYDPNLLGLDWNSLGHHYALELPRLRTRDELTLLMSRMIGELPGGHNGVNNPPSNLNRPARPRAPDPGMIVGWDGLGAKILRVLRGRSDMQMFGSLESGVEGKLLAGQYIRAVNGKPVTPTLGFDEQTVGIAPDDPVTLDISETPTGPTHRVDVHLRNHYLGYTDFLDRTIERVSERSHGRLGYLHLFDTFSQGGGAFSDGLYSQWHLDGLLIDARWNRGGNANPGFLDALQAKPLFQEIKRYGKPSLDTCSMHGPIGLLVNQETVSGGDLLASAFQSRQIGPLIGTRTSGRTIGNQWFASLIDGATVRTSESHYVDWKSGADAGENVGIQPDFDIPQPPSLEFSIHDEQLDRAVDILLSRMQSQSHPASCNISLYTTPIDHKLSDRFHALDQDLNQVQIVGFGEDTHGTAEFTELAEELMIHLAEQHSFRVLFLENGVGETIFLNDYILGKLDDAEGLLKTKISTWRYQSTQFLHLLNRLRAFNQSHPDHPIHLYGIEMHYPLEDANRLNQYLTRHGLKPLSAPFDKTLYQTISEDEKADLFIALHKTKRDLLQNRVRLIQEGPEAEFRQAELHLNILGQFVTAILQGHEQQRSELRDLYMEANLTHILATFEPESRALVWAHNAHIGDWISNGQVDVLGHHLRKRYGHKYYNLATHFGVGAYLAFPHDAAKSGWKLTPITRETIQPNSFTQTLSECGQPDAFVDFLAMRRNPESLVRLQNPFVVMAGGGAQAYGMLTTQAAWGTAFDGLLFLQKSSPIHPLP